MDPYFSGGFTRCPFNAYIHSVVAQSEETPLSDDEEG